MRRKTILNAKQINRTSFNEAEASFYKHCTLTQEVFDDFIYKELQEGKKVTSLNSRIRG